MSSNRAGNLPAVQRATRSSRLNPQISPPENQSIFFPEQNACSSDNASSKNRIERAFAILSRKFYSLTWHDFFYLFYITIAFLFLVPVFAGITFDKIIAPLSKSLVSLEFKVLNAAVIALSVPLFLDLLMDLFAPEVENFYCRVLLLLTLIIPASVFINADTSLSPTLFICFYRWQRTQWAGLTLSMLTRDAGETFTKHLCTAFMFLEMLASFFDLLSYSLGDPHYKIVALVIQHCVYLIGAFMMFLYAHNMYAQYKYISGFQFFKWTNDITHTEYASFIEVIAGSIGLCGLVLLPLANNDGNGTLLYFENITMSYFYGYYFILSMYTAIIIILPGRKARRSSDKLQINLDVKRNFVRYVGHEIRTPLNTVYMGLELLEIMVENNPHVEEDAAQTVQELRDSCKVAVELLNELLLYEKIEAGEYAPRLHERSHSDALFSLIL